MVLILLFFNQNNVAEKMHYKFWSIDVSIALGLYIGHSSIVSQHTCVQPTSDLSFELSDLSRLKSTLDSSVSI